MQNAGLEKMCAAYGRDVAVLPPSEVGSIIVAGGFDLPVLFLQTLLMHAWYAKRGANSIAEPSSSNVKCSPKKIQPMLLPTFADYRAVEGSPLPTLPTRIWWVMEH